MSVALFVLTGFGTVWLLAGNGVAGGPAALDVLIVAVAAVLFAVTIRLRRIDAAAENARRRELNAAGVWRPFMLINVAQYVAAAIVIALCNALGQPDRITGLIEAIVGLHFLPLATLFGAPVYRILGAAMTVCGAGAAIAGGVDGAVFAALSAGALLWSTALVLTVRWWQRARPVRGSTKALG